MHTGAEVPGPTPGASEVAFAPHPAPPGLAVPIPPGDDQATPRAGPSRVPLVCAPRGNAPLDGRGASRAVLRPNRPGHWAAGAAMGGARQRGAAVRPRTVPPE